MLQGILKSHNPKPKKVQLVIAYSSSHPGMVLSFVFGLLNSSNSGMASPRWTFSALELYAYVLDSFFPNEPSKLV